MHGCPLFPDPVSGSALDYSTGSIQLSPSFMTSGITHPHELSGFDFPDEGQSPLYLCIPQEPLQGVQPKSGIPELRVREQTVDQFVAFPANCTRLSAFPTGPEMVFLHYQEGAISFAQGALHQHSPVVGSQGFEPRT